MKLLKESMSVEDQERLILYASNNAKVKDKVLDVLKTEYELREDDLYDCEYVIDNASWEKEHKHEFSYWNLDTIIRDHLIDTIIEVKHDLSKHKSLSEYKNFVAKSFDPHLVIDMIREFLQEHPFENEAHNTFEDFEEYIAYELFDKEVKELTSEESYAISDVWEDLQDELKEEFLDSAVKDETLEESIDSDKLNKKDYSFEYQLLDRLRSDCDYYLGVGGRANKHLWAGTPEGQIAKMKELWNKLPEKPEWLSMEDIEAYEKEMIGGDKVQSGNAGKRFKHKVATTESAKRIVANIYDKSGNILETRHFSSKKQLDSFVDNLNNLIDMTADNNVPFKDSKGNMGIWDIWKITVDDLMTEEAKKKKELGAFVKLDAGDVEEGNKFFNKAVAGAESEGGCNMSEDLRTINIRDELNKLDTIDYNDLVNMYNCLKLSDLEKTQLAQLLANHDNENVIKFISDRYYKENMCEQVENEYSDAPNTLLSKRDRLSKRLSEIDQERAKIEKTIDYQQDHNYSMIDFDLMDRLDELNMEAEIINKKLEEI